MVIVSVAPVEFVQLWSVTPSVMDSVVSAKLVKSVKLVALVIVGVGVVVAGQVQQYLFGEDFLNTGQPGYQFWKVRGSPLAHWDQDILELLVELLVELLRFLRRPTQQSEVTFRAMVWMFSGVSVTSSLKQT